MKLVKSVLIVVFVFASVGISFSQTQNDSIKTISVKVKGINCHMDVKTISSNVEKLKGVYSCEAKNPGATTEFTIKYDPALLTERDIHSVIENTSGCEDPEEKPYRIKK